MDSKHVFTVQWAPVTQFLYLVIFFIQIFHFLSKIRCTSCLLAIRYPKYLFLSPPFIPAPTIFQLKGFRFRVSLLEKFFPVPSLQRKVTGDVNTPAGQVFRSCKHLEPRALDFQKPLAFLQRHVFFFFRPPSLSFPPVSPHPRSKYRGSSERVNERVAKAVARARRTTQLRLRPAFRRSIPTSGCASLSS